MNTNILVTIEGPDGVGKTTVIEELKKQLSHHPCIFTRDPGGVQSAELIRDIVKGEYGIDKYSELLLYTAARNEVVNQSIIPAIDDGKICIIDRFAISTVVYQENLQRIIQLSKPMVEKLMENGILVYNYVLIADSDIITKRKKSKVDVADRFDLIDSSIMRDKYIRCAYALKDLNNHLFENMRIIDANGSAEHTAKLIFDDLITIIES